MKRDLNKMCVVLFFSSRFLTLKSCIFGLFLLFQSSYSTAQNSATDEQVANSLYAILVNTTWENQAAIQTFKIGVLDTDTAFYGVLRKKYAGVTLKGKKVDLIYFKSIDALSSTQVLWVDKKFNKKIDKFAKSLFDNHTLLVTNSFKDENFTMLNFNGRLKKDDFSINLKNMERAGLKLNSQVEEYVQGGTVQWEEMLKESTQKLEQERQITATKDQTIKAQKARLSYQKLTLEEKIKLLDEQSSLLEKQAMTLENQLLDIHKQEEELKSQKEQIAAQEGEINKQLEALGMQRVILIMAMAVLLLIVGIGYIMYRNSQQRKKSIVQLSEQHALVSEQKSQIERILFELTDSIRYALRIQNAVLPNEQTIRGTVPGDFFVIYKPKDIVSGDFFFVDRRGDWTLVAVADCTGHGVPGAFVSMLCISLLNEIVKQKEVVRADLILNELRDKVIHSLQQKGVDGEQMDGMDISLLLINNKTYHCHWSGANNPLYIVSSKEKKLEELKPDKRPISIYPDMKEFTNHEIVANKGDVFYLFTDGYSDQFGGEKGKKFMSRNFKNLLHENAHKPMQEQGEIVDRTIEEWKTTNGINFEQVDDITVLGIRIS